MSLKSFLSVTDDKLHDLFSKKPHDPTKARAAMIKRLDKTQEQFDSATPVKGRKLFTIANGVVRLTLPFEADAGKNVFLIPSERFGGAIKDLKAAINSGELDSALEKSETAIPADGSNSAPKLRKSSGPRRKLSPEALEARRAKMRAAGTLTN